MGTLVGVEELVAAGEREWEALADGEVVVALVDGEELVAPIDGEEACSSVVGQSCLQLQVVCIVPFKQLTS